MLCSQLWCEIQPRLGTAPGRLPELISTQTALGFDHYVCVAALWGSGLASIEGVSIEAI